MRLRIAVTDNSWFRFLRGLPGVDEVNFWKPGGEQTFKALAPGEPLLFKLHSPENFIVGGGFFVRFLFLPWSFAWDSFGPKNGTATLDEMRRQPPDSGSSPSGPPARSEYSVVSLLTNCHGSMSWYACESAGTSALGSERPEINPRLFQFRSFRAGIAAEEALQTYRYFFFL